MAVASGADPKRASSRRSSLAIAFRCAAAPVTPVTLADPTSTDCRRSAIMRLARDPVAGAREERMKVNGDYEKGGYAHLERLIPPEVTKALLNQFWRDLFDEKLPV